MSQAYRYRYIVGANSWLQKVASAQQIAESLDDVFSLSSFRNAQWNQWLSLKVQVQPVLRCVLACGRSLRFRQGKKQPVAFAEKRLSILKVGTASSLMKHLTGAHAIRWQAHQIGVSLLARWLEAKKARTSGCVRQENDMQLTSWRETTEMWTSGHPRPCVDGYIAWNRSPWRERRTR